MQTVRSPPDDSRQRGPVPRHVALLAPAVKSFDMMSRTGAISFPLRAHVLVLETKRALRPKQTASRNAHREAKHQVSHIIIVISRVPYTGQGTSEGVRPKLAVFHLSALRDSNLLPWRRLHNCNHLSPAFAGSTSLRPLQP
jgi:hypothetical protein